jgi:hypothetical protein
VQIGDLKHTHTGSEKRERERERVPRDSTSLGHLSMSVPRGSTSLVHHTHVGPTHTLQVGPTYAMWHHFTGPHRQAVNRSLGLRDEI